MLLAIIAFLFSLFSIKNDFSKGFHFFEAKKKQSESTFATKGTGEVKSGAVLPKDKPEKSKEDETDAVQKENSVNENTISSVSTQSESNKSAKETDIQRKQ